MIKKTFGIKGITTIQNTDLTYYGNWNGNGSIHESTAPINNTDAFLSYSGNWVSLNNGAATASNYHYVNSGAPFQLANDTSSSITYTRGGWLTYSAFNYNDVLSNRYVVTNQETDINKIKYIYNGSYNDPPQSPSPKEEAWSNSMHLAWRTQMSSEGISYTHSRESTSRIEIPFTGTNIQVYQFKNSVMGQCKIEVYDSSNNKIRDLIVDNYNFGGFLLSKTVISGLPSGNNKLVIQGIDGNRFNFVRAEVLPSIEYKFTGNNIRYNAFTANNCGKVNITIDNDPSTTETIDLYDASNIYQNVYSRTNLGTGEHTITIDALGERNTSSTGFRINVNEFNAIPSVRGTFSGEYLNLKLIGTPNSGIANLYIDNTYHSMIDMYSPTSSYYSINVTGLTNTDHTFELRATNTKNTSSTGTRINFDGYTTNRASYTFTGVGVKYFANKNNNQGMVDVWIDGNKYGTYDLYSSTAQTGQEIVNITGLSNDIHTIDIIPAGVKKWNANDYKINVDYIEIEETTYLNKVVWRGNDGGTNRIYVSSFDGAFWTSPTMISTSSSNNESPQINSDGNRTTWVGSGHIYVSDWYGASWNTPTIISTSSSDNSFPQVSSNGNKITWGGYDGSQYKIYVSEWDGSGWNTPTIISTSSTGNMYPQISADGNRIIWVGNDGSTNRIYVSDWNGSSWNTPTIISTSSTNNNEQPQISTDGNRITWSGYNGSTNRIYVSDWNGSTWTTPTIVSTSPSWSNNPQISSDGNRITWQGIEVDYKIYVSSFNGSSWTTPTMISTSSSDNAFPQISSDGNRITWYGNDGSTNRIYVSDWNGSSWTTPTMISTSSSDNAFPQISSDGNRITWYGNDGSTNRIYVSSWNGSSWTTPTMISNSSTNNWVPQIN